MRKALALAASAVQQILARDLPVRESLVFR
jgi:hypothetical protein